jgi:5-methyltetrahydrofolate--homocysteine methyltransferase
MSLYFKEDWDSAKTMLDGWWKQTVQGRWALGVWAPRDSALPVPEAPPAPNDHRTRWLDIEGNFARREKWFSETWFGGCVYPEDTACLGPGSLNVFLGTPTDFMLETVWYHPKHSDPEKVAALKLDKTEFFWKWTVEALQYQKKHGQGRFITSFPDLIEGLDTLAELFGTQNMLTHLFDYPEDIHRLLKQLDKIYFEAYDPLFDLLKLDDGSSSYMCFNAWGPGRISKLQCDFSAMISPDMFAEFVTPHLRKQAKRLDLAVYHLDGPDAIRHLPEVLSIKDIQAVQWSSGAGQPHPADKKWWKTVWEHVYASGKSAMLHHVPFDEIEPFIKEFGQAGTMITTSCQTESAAKRLLDESLNWK